MCFEIFFTECKKNTRQSRLCRVPEKQHSANHLALGKEPVSGSDLNEAIIGISCINCKWASPDAYLYFIGLVIRITSMIKLICGFVSCLA